MNHLFSLLNVAAIVVLLGSAATGCVRTSGVRVTEPYAESSMESHVAQRLKEAAESIEDDLALLTGSRSIEAMTDKELSKPINFVWHGPLDTALACMAAEVGFRFVRKGEPPARPVLARVSAKNRPWIDIVRDIGRQTGSHEKIRVDEAARTITLSYL